MCALDLNFLRSKLNIFFVMHKNDDKSCQLCIVGVSNNFEHFYTYSIFCFAANTFFIIATFKITFFVKWKIIFSANLFCGFSVCLVCVVQSDLELVDVRLDLLLDPQSLLLRLRLGIQRSLKGFLG
jgi:hypothetical protein